MIYTCYESHFNATIMGQHNVVITLQSRDLNAKVGY